MSRALTVPPCPPRALRLRARSTPHRRQAAIVERQALGAEAANYARIVMAAMMADPAKTGITETGPDSPSAIALSEITEIPLAGVGSDGPQ